VSDEPDNEPQALRRRREAVGFFRLCSAEWSLKFPARSRSVRFVEPLELRRHSGFIVGKLRLLQDADLAAFPLLTVAFPRARKYSDVVIGTIDVPQSPAEDWHVGVRAGPGDNLSTPPASPDYCFELWLTWPGRMRWENQGARSQRSR